ncbi:NAD-glutamate dehydrogenase [Caulobacter sp. 17J80-11]|uniref:NAD-glutamate dehydrogenase n=1 Tax=Caulobacter sp. 17J80-11 TaxID=2763502 RepID=UPI001653B3A0|nr:NAD-glutamate dehydrogenase [Caulobacter sp. 17J80-11]MBC6983326.1 NAD-glutamate dehydrogenase [Caulobacter sp. 17J80-11]
MDGAGVPTLTIDALKKAFAKALGRPGATELDRLEHSFLEQALEDYVADETPQLSPEDFAAVLADFWKFGEVREGGAGPMIRLRRATGAEGRPMAYDVLEIVQDDAPFLVDSVMGELADHGVSVRAMFHPVLTLERFGQGLRRAHGDTQRESTILVVIDPVAEDRRAGLIEGLQVALADVRAAVADFTPMQELLGRTVAELEKGVAGVDPALVAEQAAFLKWLNADHFVFLGARVYDYPRTADGGYEAEAPLSQPQQGLGLLRDPNRPVLRRANEPAVLTRQMKQQLNLGEPVTVAKANLRSRVHRRGYMDFIGIKRFGPDGKPTGEVRFVGLFTAEAYDLTASQVPLIRRKVANVMARAAKAPGSHNEKRLRNIVENYPRDELFQMTEDDLLRIALGVLHLFDRPRIRLFTRRDPLDRFVSVLMYVPRERYDPGVRERAGEVMAKAWGGRVSAWYPQLSDAPLVRIHYIIGVQPGAHPEPDPAEVEARVVEVSRAWPDRFEQAVRESGIADAEVGAVTSRWAEGFPVAYRDRYDVAEALVDMAEVDRLGDGEIAVRAFRAPTDSSLQFRFKLYRHGEAVPLADVLPILEDMGLKALEEYGNPVRPAGATEPVWVHEFLLEDPRGADLVFRDIKKPFEEAFAAVWTGRTESDGFNRLVLELSISWREAALIRALARYRQQSGLDPSQATQEAALIENPAVGRLILKLFAAKFDPAHAGDAAARAQAVEALTSEILTALQAVASLDHDRALRRIALLVGAVKRTNYYQVGPDGGPKPYISFKIASRELADLPLPKPYREIFVWSPHVEGVHLRFGPVARGGLRWSDRRDDFRTEVLGLVKAQQVKNAVIVPVGSKGGFYPKQLPRGGAPDAIRAEGVRAYKTFLSGLLDITDNIDAKNAVIRPANVIAWEGDDPYLVVAADKGTATFSDIANGVSADYGFWLGDAFASGGSVGYDHKAMGITARGAWEAVKRHFREMGKDIQTQPFTVVGVGDMSGDVFGNGMLLSKAIKLVAAFDHRDIFLDPNPDPAVSWNERKRLFDLPRSSWQDYDKSLISAGGGVFSRSLKSIPLTPEVKAVLGVSEDSLSPTDLMRAILKAEAELLYFGGIGTYVKAPSESDLQVGDKANDAIRVDGNELRVDVVGEGANLGVTQAGRIAFAQNGGRINTDAIDNSAGVDTSDHEVNIKILTGGLERKGELEREARNALLASMTDEVAQHVLQHNYDQTLALTLQEASAAADAGAHERFMRRLEQAGKLDRKVEGLPSTAAMVELQNTRRGLTRPELAVLTAYAKIELFDEVVASAAPDDAFFETTLKDYFPTPLRRYQDEMDQHRLRREIIATVISNEMVNMTGATFPSRVRATAGCDARELVVAFEAARQALRLDEAWSVISSLDLKIPAEAQTALYREAAGALRRLAFWLARRAARGGATVQQLIDVYRPAVDAVRAEGASLLSDFDQAAMRHRVESLVAAGAPADLAASIAVLRPLTATSDMAELAGRMHWPVAATARLYHQVGAAFAFDRLRSAAGSLAPADHFERLAVRRLIEDLLSEQAALTLAIGKAASPASVGNGEAARQAIQEWVRARSATVDHARKTIEEIEQAGAGWSFAKLTIANAAIRELASAA